MNLVDEIQNKLRSFQLDQCLFHAKIPVTAHVIKKNNRPIHRRGRKPFIGKSAKLRNQEINLRKQLDQIAAAQGIKFPIRDNIHAIFHFHFGPELSRSFALSDLSNLFEIVSDSLQSTKKGAFKIGGVIENDRQIKSFDGSRKFKNRTSFLEIFLLKFTENVDLSK